MLYLAEVQKQKGGLLGGGNKADLKLLACQRSDQSWSSVSEEVIAADDASKLSDGALVMVELTPQRQIQRIQEAGRPLVTILQNFSRQMEKFKAAEEEIEGWKQSLTFQAQEFNRRQEEMEEQMARFQAMEQEMQEFEAQKQQIESSQAEIEALRQEIERNRQELEGAWEHLRGEQRRLEELQAEGQGSGLDPEQAQKLGELVESVAGGLTSIAGMREQLNYGLEVVEHQQSCLNPHWEILAAIRSEVEQQQADVELREKELRDRQNEVQQAQALLDAQIAEFKANHATLISREAQARMLKEQIYHQEDLYQQMSSLAASSGQAIFLDGEILAILESMPIDELEQKVKDLQEKLTVDSSFVDEQETELTYKQATIEEILQKLNQATDAEKPALESELADEKDHYQMLNETLVGQRRSLIQRQEELSQYQAILWKRQGKTLENQRENQIDLRPLLTQVDKFRQQQVEDLEELERELESLRSSVELAQGLMENQMQAQATKQQELQDLQEEFHQLQSMLHQKQVRISVYEELLQPVQDALDRLRQSLQVTSEICEQVQAVSHAQSDSISKIREVLTSLASHSPV